MELEGVVTNVANFGAFVDIGVHQDGLVHVSQLADRYVSDPNQIVKVGQVVKVRVLEVNVGLKRISLSMRADAQGDRGSAKPAQNVAKPAPQSAGQPKVQKQIQKQAPKAQKQSPQDTDQSTSLDDLKARFNRKA
jgi:protein Tex